MRLRIPFTILLFMFVWTTASAHKDRIEKPKTYKFVFLDGQSITFNNASDAMFTAYCNDIKNGKQKLTRAELLFRTGETLTFEGNGDSWKKIKISDGNGEFLIPAPVTKRIPIVHFATVALLWDGRDEKAFMASYFYIRFNIGIEKSFNVYPELHLSFTEKQFSKSTVLRQVSKSSSKETDF